MFEAQIGKKLRTLSLDYFLDVLIKKMSVLEYTTDSILEGQLYIPV